MTVFSSDPRALPKAGAMATLRQFAHKRAPIESCEMCSRELRLEHQHLIDPEKRKLICACDACAVLFATQAGTKLRRVPRRVRFLPDFRMSESQWNSLMIPIEMAFFFYSSQHGRVIAFYPSPAGATESLLALETWNDVVTENPLLGEMTPDVEALLVNRIGAARGVVPQYYVAPIDECYKLVGLIRLNWHGLSGGTEMWREITKYFLALKAKAGVPGENANA
ncbi:MAG: DUF5947 family protein [Candidatus Acidiferrales bacterium]